jgi:ABC-type uncharacterized transport system auxiliary subunit
VTWIGTCLLAVVAALGAGCGGAIPKTHYYLLDLTPAAPRPRQPAPYTVAVMPFQVPDHLEQDRIVFRPSPLEIDFYEYHRWAHRPASLLTSALVDRLRSQNVFAGVLQFDGRTRTDFRIRARLERFEEVDSPEGVTARVQLSAEVTDLKNQRIAWTGSADHAEPVTQGEVRAVVAALSRAAEACVAEISQGIEGFAAGLPAASVASSGAP